MPSSLGGVQLIIVILVLTPFAILAIGLRLWSRHINHSPLAFNDHMAILALLLTIAENIFSLIDAFVGVSGVHVSEIIATDPSLLQTYLKLATPGIILWAAANTCVKLSILSLYTTLFPSRKFHHVCHGTMVISVAFAIVVFLEAFLLCTPVQFNWDKSIPGGVCNQSVAFLSSGIINLVIDAFIVILPIPILFKLQMPSAKKLGVAVMFSLGAVICIISLFRIIALSNWDLDDVTFGSAEISIYSSVEPTLGVVNACLPTIKPALYKLWGKGSYGVSKSHFKDSRKASLDKYDQNPMGMGIHEGRFHHHDDQIPLTTIRAENGVSGGNERDAITVTRAWEVHS
ncbi:hypothetical protein F5Y09DRAFT_335560 [Xylaria sp. FL1042]|nr:hypothetical protein F5Y09DRAFT_335560 [Xylaria sp. FL1042]